MFLSLANVCVHRELCFRQCVKTKLSPLLILLVLKHTKFLQNSVGQHSSNDDLA